MRLTCSLRAIIRSRDNAFKDMSSTYAVMSRYGWTMNKERQAIDAQHFSVSSTQGALHRQDISDGIYTDPAYPRLLRIQSSYQKIRFLYSVNPRWIMHRRAFNKAGEALANREMIVNGSRVALKRILEAIRKKDLSSLSPLLLDDSILADITKKSNLSSLTDRQLKCLDVSDDDFIGMDGIVDRWKRIELAEDDPSGLITSIKFGVHEKGGERILTYSVDMMAIVRKKILISKLGSLIAFSKHQLRDDNDKMIRTLPAPKAYGLPYMRFMYATVEFAHKETEERGKFSEEPFLLNFHVHSM